MFISKHACRSYRAGIAVLVIALTSIGVAAETPRAGLSVNFSHGDLKVSENKRFLVHADGTPFFYLGDTAWELFHRLNREEAEKYLEKRREQGFTVIQAVVLAELDGLNTPNALGQKPLIDNDPAKPNEVYFKHVDFITDTAARKGIYIGMLPTWGDKVVKRWGVGPEIFNPGNAYAYGVFLGRRYKDRPNIIWILGGDRSPDNDKHIETFRAMGKGLHEGDGGKHLMTYHPQGGASSARWFHGDLDFNMFQSGHGARDIANYEMVAKDYAREPVKPTFDGEPRYEDHPVNWKHENGYFNDFDARQAAYWNLFAGGHGHTYGAQPIWQMIVVGKNNPASPTRRSWFEALELPGAWDMMHARNLIESRPFVSRVPDPSLIAGGQAEGEAHVQGARGEGYAFVYIPTGKNVTINLGKISGEQVKAWWYDPRTGEAKEIGAVPNKGTKEFDAPGDPARGNDWVLVLDDASKNFGKPGASQIK